MTYTDGRTYPRYDRAGAGTGYSRGCVMLHHAVTSAQHTARLRGAVVVAPNFLFQFITRGAARRVSCLVPRTVRSLSGWLVLPVLSTLYSVSSLLDYSTSHF